MKEVEENAVERAGKEKLRRRISSRKVNHASLYYELPKAKWSVFAFYGFFLTNGTLISASTYTTVGRAELVGALGFAQYCAKVRLMTA